MTQLQIELQRTLHQIADNRELAAALQNQNNTLNKELQELCRQQSKDVSLLLPRQEFKKLFNE